ncbi:MAG: hypothetical protein HYZ43_03855 [Flavobacteriia bacterium]|nr:hypothetical protein [Flavobacteriia bacterium]
MKIKLLVLSLFSCMAVMAAKTVTVTVKWTFEEVVEGYDHDNKILVFVDGKSMGESQVYKESAKATYSFEVTKGKHTIKIVDYSFYEGKWDIHTKENQYSVDAFYEGEINCTANTTINMLFNVDKESSDFTVTGGKEVVAKGVPLMVTWIYKNVEEGFDHENRMVVYIDGKKMGTSAIFAESKKGSMTVNVPPGQHDVVIENYAFYEGQWELHSIENNYSVDAFYSTNMIFAKKKRSVNLVFDIETLETTPTVK